MGGPVAGPGRALEEDMDMLSALFVNIFWCCFADLVLRRLLLLCQMRERVRLLAVAVLCSLLTQSIYSIVWFQE